MPPTRAAAAAASGSLAGPLADRGGHGPGPRDPRDPRDPHGLLRGYSYGHDSCCVPVSCCCRGHGPLRRGHGYGLHSCCCHSRCCRGHAVNRPRGRRPTAPDRRGNYGSADHRLPADPLLATTTPTIDCDSSHGSRAPPESGCGAPHPDHHYENSLLRVSASRRVLCVCAECVVCGCWCLSS